MSSAAIGAPRADVRLYVAPGEYYGVAYVPPPAGGADYVYFRGEPLSIRVSAINHGAAVAVSADIPALRLRIERLRAAERAVRNVRVAHEETVLTVRGRTHALTFPVTIEQSDSIAWSVALAGLERAATGIYEIKVFPSLRVMADGVSRSSPTISSDVVRLDVRDVARPEDMIELLRIGATRAYINRDYARCKALSARLLKSHPASVFGRILMADLAAAQGDHTAAAEGYARALQALQRGEDQLLLQNAGSFVAQELAVSVQGKLARSQ